MFVSTLGYPDEWDRTFISLDRSFLTWKVEDLGQTSRGETQIQNMCEWHPESDTGFLLLILY